MDKFLTAIGMVPGAIAQAFAQWAAETAHQVLVVGGTALGLIAVGVAAAYGLKRLADRAHAQKAEYFGIPAE